RDSSGWIVVAVVGQEDAATAALASLDATAGNVSLRGQLGWDEATYERIKDQLIAAGRIKRGKGRGGSVFLPDDGHDDPPG
ncbi:MAG: hypothetical protein EBX36_00100, partial [Planctomycetia bacterium]|nr:hypothetical protein [Planctomycetia bacterium]